MYLIDQLFSNCCLWTSCGIQRCNVNFLFYLCGTWVYLLLKYTVSLVQTVKNKNKITRHLKKKKISFTLVSVLDVILWYSICHGSEFFPLQKISVFTGFTVQHHLYLYQNYILKDFNLKSQGSVKAWKMRKGVHAAKNLRTV